VAVTFCDRDYTCSLHNENVFLSFIKSMDDMRYIFRTGCP